MPVGEHTCMYQHNQSGKTFLCTFFPAMILLYLYLFGDTYASHLYLLCCTQTKAVQPGQVNASNVLPGLTQKF